MRHHLMETVLILCVFLATAEGSCLNNTNCPSHKPYCTPVGCVYTCPEGSFIDGMNCVEDCKEQFIHNRSCVSTCPIFYPYTIEKVDIRGIQFIKQKLCSKTCPDNTFKYNGLCEQACPAEALFSLNGSCMKHCPDSHRFERNITNDGRVVSRECLVNCSGKYPVRTGLSYNTCITKCPEDHKVYNDSICVRNCPGNAPFETSYVVTKNYGSYQSKSIRCTPNCEGLYYNNTTCIDKCPMYALDNKTCIESCPETAPFVLEHSRSHYVPRFWAEMTPMCKASCPLDTFIFNNTCFPSCPHETNIYNGSCVHSCPEHNPFVFHGTCLENCPNNYYIDGFMCVGLCPEDKYHHNKSMTCVETCPQSAPLMYDKHLPNVWHSRLHPNKLCLEMCPERMYVFNQTCLSYCPRGSKNYNNVCVENCPSESPYNKLNFLHFACIDKCPGNLFIDGYSCLLYCPKNKYVFGSIFNNSCVTECPSSRPLSKDGYCVDDCKTEFKYRSKCFKACPSNTVIFTKSCVEECPSSHPLIKTSIIGVKTCVEKCSYAEVSLNGHCIYISDCKAKIVTVDGKCLDECPDGYIWISTDVNRGDDKPKFPVCHSKAAIWILFVLALLFSFNSAMMYWRCFSPTFEAFIDLLCCRDHHKLPIEVEDDLYKDSDDEKVTVDSRDDQTSEGIEVEVTEDIEEQETCRLDIVEPRECVAFTNEAFDNYEAHNKQERPGDTKPLLMTGSGFQQNRLKSSHASSETFNTNVADMYI